MMRTRSSQRMRKDLTRKLSTTVTLITTTLVSKTLERSYLLRIDGKVVERPQHMLMRVSIGIHKKDIEKAVDTYHMLSERWMTHASPTLFNAGTPRPQLSSCFLICMKEDSIEGIYDTLKECACISKSAGGIGLSIHDIRATSSYIRGTNGTSNGIIPMLRCSTTPDTWTSMLQPRATPFTSNRGTLTSSTGST